ncbi:MAG: pantoate--beta-alanine ligase [Spirochaetota bacterium]|jgi:pantoate--beta-alanine ligase|nr:pantoate--beta-alanine ligase [Spirochaetota bacterium]
MRVIDAAAELRALSREWRREGRRVALVPTMGALHEGHLSLVRIAQTEGARVIVTIYVNPTQFSPSEDLAAYPRTLDRDCALLNDLGVDAVFAPKRDMYLPDHTTWVTVDGLTTGLCGASRPTHFRGVTTIVAKLLHIAEPDIAVFGQKDYQQARVIERMMRDMDFPVVIRVGPIVREADGLAMSSRNRFLSPEDRAAARVLSRTLFACSDRARAGASLAELCAFLDASLADRARGELDYAVIAHPATLGEIRDLSEGALIALAMRFGSARLIDNILIEPQK